MPMSPVRAATVLIGRGGGDGGLAWRAWAGARRCQRRKALPRTITAATMIHGQRRRGAVGCPAGAGSGPGVLGDISDMSNCAQLPTQAGKVIFDRSESEL